MLIVNVVNHKRPKQTLSEWMCFYFVDLLPAKNGEEVTMQFLLEVVEILTNYVRKTFDRSTKVLDFHHPHQLLEGMEGFNLELSDQPESLEQILVDCRDTLKYGVRTGGNKGLKEQRVLLQSITLISFTRQCSDYRYAVFCLRFSND